MKRLYEFITRANQVLLFVALLGIIGGIGFLIVNEASRHSESPHVAVTPATHETVTDTVKDVRYLNGSSGIYVFGIAKKAVAESEATRGKGFALDSRGSRDDQGETVNIVFSKGDQKVRTLLPSDGLVLRSQLNGAYGRVELKAHVFLCVVEDTDHNKILDNQDRKDLYVVPADLGKPDLVVTDVVDFEESPTTTHVVVKTKVEGAVRFWDINTETFEKHEVRWE